MLAGNPLNAIFPLSKFATEFEKSFDQATIKLSKIIEQCGDKLIIDKVKIRNDMQAKEYEFDGDPMIRVNEIPITLEKTEENEFVWRGAKFFCPPASFVEEKILMNLYRDDVM